MAGSETENHNDSEPNGASDWAAWLGWLRNQADPLGVRALLERSARALDAAQTPAEAAAAIGAAIEAEQASQRAAHGQLGALLTQWGKTLQAIAPMLPDHRMGEDLPTLGPFPRRQDLLQALARDTDAYQQALAEHLTGVTDLAEDCLAAFRAALAEAPSNPDALAETWMAVAEPRYEAWLDEPRTQSRLAAVINTWGQLVATLRALGDETLEALGLPSARALDDLAAELQRQRRRQRREIAELRAEIAALREQLNASMPPPQAPSS